MTDLFSILQNNSIEIQPDGSPKQRNGSQYLFYNQCEIKGKLVEFAYFGDFKTGETGTWSSLNGNANDPELRDEVEKRMRELRENREKEKLSDQESAASRAWDFYFKCNQTGTHKYLERKKIKLHAGFRIYVPQRILVIPMYDISGRIKNVQKIYENKQDFGDKLFLRGGQISGCFFNFGELNEQTKTVYIAEGIATAASIYESLWSSTEPCSEIVVFAAFNANNLRSVGEAITEKIKKNGFTAKIVFCADDDRFTTLADGSRFNTGLVKATQAAASLDASVITPVFKKNGDSLKLTDFNDLSVVEGLKEVRRQVGRIQPELKKIQLEFSDPTTIEAEPMKDERDPLPDFSLLPKKDLTENLLAKALLQTLDGRIYKEGQDLFMYSGTHWTICGTRETDILKTSLTSMWGERFNATEVERLFKTFVRLVPHIPPSHSFFMPVFNAANFLDGTLHLSRVNGEYQLDFKPHSKLDFITSTLPYEYKKAEGAHNQFLMEAIENIWRNDPDLAEKSRAYAQFLGSCLIGAFPQCFLFVGPGGSGKTTLLKVAARLVHLDNLSSVDPSEMKDFHLEPMVNKLVNINTDIDTRQPIKDALIKKLIDRMPFNIPRKFKHHVMALLPAIHGFGANDMPKSFEGGSKAMHRRWVILRTDSFRSAEGSHDNSFSDVLFESSPEGILAFALAGLRDLCNQGGQYCRPKSSIEEMHKWDSDNDVVLRFFTAMRDGDIKVQGSGLLNSNQVLTEDKDLEIERGQLFDIFKEYAAQEMGAGFNMGRNTFMRRVKSIYVLHRYTQKRCFQGLGLV